MTAPIDPTRQPMTLLGGLTAAQFMRRHWQKQPLLVRQALPDLKPPMTVTALKKLSRQDDVESRLIWRDGPSWAMKSGPLARLPAKTKPDWTLLVQSVDLHNEQAADLLYRFNFVPSARLDDLMISIASTGGGVGPHFDSYDVFLIQAQGRRRWRFSQQKDLSLVDDLPLKILSNFEPEYDVVLEPGDMLYLPPNAAHDGVAVDDDCMTLSVGFKAPTGTMMAQRLLEAAADDIALTAPATLMRPFTDPNQSAVSDPAALPEHLLKAALASVARINVTPALAAESMGCWLTEPNQLARFEPSDQTLDPDRIGELRLDRRTRLIYWKQRLFINGEPADVPATALLKRLANDRKITLDNRTQRRLRPDIYETLEQWLVDGWVHWHPID